MSEQKDSPLVILCAVCAAQFFMPFMVAGVNSILPPIGEATGASASELSLLSTYYILGLVISQLIAGRMGDIWGRRKIFLVGGLLFVVTNFCMGFMDNIYIMHVLRTFQGLGTALFSACGLAILAVVAPEGKRNEYVAYSATCIYMGIACGPPVAGFIAEHFGWQWLFWGTGSAGLLAWCFMRFAVHEEWYAAKGEPFNWTDACIYALGMGCLAMGSSLLKDTYLGGGALMLAGTTFIILYVWQERHTKYPLLDVRLLAKNRVFALSALAALVNYSACFGMVLFFSLYLQVVRGVNISTAGLYLSVQFLVQAIVSPMAGRLASKYGGGRVSAVGITLCGLGLCATAFLDRESSMAFFLVAQVCLGLGIGLFAAPNTSVMLESVDKAHLGQAASVSGSVRTVGALLNTSVITVTFGYFLGDAPVSTENIDAFLQSMKVDLLFFGCMNIAAIGFALGRERIAK